jgi:hypothetical protein
VARLLPTCILGRPSTTSPKEHSNSSSKQAGRGSSENGAQATGTPAAAELIPAGQEITLTVGDTVYYDGEAVQAERNDGDTPAVVLVSNLRGADEPAREFVD